MRPGKARIIFKGLQQNKDIRERYRIAYKEIETFLKEQRKDGKQQEEKTSGEQPKVIVGSASVRTTSFVTQDTSFSIFSYPLTNSFILDCGSLVHICNDVNRFD